MKKITVIGVYGVGSQFTTGQAVKSIELINWLVKTYSENDINIVNTHSWKKNPVRLLIHLTQAFFVSDNIVMLPAQNGIKVFAPLIYILNIFFHRSIHYVVVGGWLPSMLEANSFLKRIVKSFDGIYVELPSMADQLKINGLIQARYLPNVRNYSDTIIQKKRENVCIYSRIIETKGIHDAIEIVKKFNNQTGLSIKLDIYGMVGPEFESEFNNLLEINSDFVQYKGVNGPNQGVETVSNYKILLFPTYYEGEGFAGTILDAFGSGTPVIANDWKYNKEIIESGVNGFIYSYRDVNEAAHLLQKLYNNDSEYNKISEAAKLKSISFLPDNVYPELVNNFRGI